MLTEVRSESVQIRVSASGTVAPERDVKISPKQAGLLKALNVNQGDLVKRSLIAVMDDSNIRGRSTARLLLSGSPGELSEIQTR